MGKYFQVTIKPTIDVASLAAGNIDDTEILFDWFGFDIPKGVARLMDITMLYRGKNATAATAQDLELIWAKGNVDGSAPITLGDDGAIADTPGSIHNIVGKTFIDVSAGTNDADLAAVSTSKIVTTAYTNGGAAASHGVINFGYMGNYNLLLQGQPNSGTSVGYDKVYVAGIAKATHNWGASTMTIDTPIPSTERPTVTVADGTALTSLSVGDVLRDEDNLLIGTIKSVDSATVITLEDNSASAPAENKLVYNTTPITFVLSFEI